MKAALAISVVLLVGVLVMTYGHLHGSEAALYGGMLLALAGVIAGVIQFVIRGNR